MKRANIHEIAYKTASYLATRKKTLMLLLCSIAIWFFAWQIEMTAVSDFLSLGIVALTALLLPVHKSWKWVAVSLLLLAIGLAIPTVLPDMGITFFADHLELSPLLVLFALFLFMRAIGQDRYIGILLLVLGTALMAILHLLGFTFVNRILAFPLFFVVYGLLFHILAKKQESEY